ncbi:MAG: hypothetical protein ACI8UO_002995 [Verrucomicrobiales bacterium]|jgi:hypothetical protein
MEELSEVAQRVFAYPVEPVDRKHEPRGYSDYQSFKPWLRDEFTFRCIYCLSRERWFPDGHSAFGADHVIPQSGAPELISVYDNLVYACSNCNSFRQDRPLPMDLEAERIAEHIRMKPDGALEALSDQGEELIDKCQLNRPKLVEFRARLLKLVGSLDDSLPDEVRTAIVDFFRFPDDLPDLARLRPPEGNAKPESVGSSFYAQSARGELPRSY